MKLDTSTYYPKSPLDDDPDDPGRSASSQTDETAPSQADETAPSHQADNTSSSHQAEESPDLPPTDAENFLTRVSNLLSWVFVPLLMPVYGTLAAFGLSILSLTTAGIQWSFTAIVFAFNVVIPGAVFYLLKRAGVIHDVGLNEQKERLVPYLVCIICLVATALFMNMKAAPAWLVLFYWGGAAAGVIELIINRWWKISVHAAGTAGIVALIAHLLIYEYCMPQTFAWLIVSIVLSGLLGSARVWLGRHTPMQVLAGYAVGFLAVFFAMMLNLN